MNVLAVIPARLGATRLPRKPLRPLGGKPLVIRVLERVQALGVADDCVVATDSDEVMRAVSRAGGRCVMTDAGHPSGTDRVAEVARHRDFARFDLVLNVQGDEPFVAEDALRGALDMCHRWPLGTVAVPAAPDVLGAPNVVKVVRDDAGRAMYFSRAPIPWLREEADAVLHRSLVLQHVGVYAYRRDALLAWVALPPHPLELVERLEQLRPLAAGLGMGVAVCPGPVEPGIDTEADLVRANARWTALHAG